jgi:hypothetical protein
MQVFLVVFAGMWIVEISGPIRLMVKTTSRSLDISTSAELSEQLFGVGEGVGVGVRVGVFVAVGVGVRVGVFVAVGVLVFVGVAVCVGVFVGA